MIARVIVLAGPSGAGKSRLAQRLELPILRLDDFYRDHDEPGLPLIADGPNAGLIDWDHPGSWRLDDAIATIRELCRSGAAEVPDYDIATSSRTGRHVLDLNGATAFVAEGIFASLVVQACHDEGLLEAAFCITQRPIITFWRRLSRDLRERRKPPLMLLRRGLDLMRAQREVVAEAVALGCTVATAQEAFAQLRSPQDNPWGEARR